MCVAFSKDSQIVATGSWDRTILIWNVNTGEIVIEFTKHTSYITNIKFSNTNKYLAANSMDRSTYLWDLNSKDIKLKFDKSTVINFSFSLLDNYISITDKDNLTIWDIKVENTKTKILSQYSNDKDKDKLSLYKGSYFLNNMYFISCSTNDSSSIITIRI